MNDQDLLNRILDKIKELNSEVGDVKDTIGEIKVTMVENTASLKEHMRRTEILEKQVDSIPQKVLIFISIVSGFVTVFTKIIH